MNENPLVTLSSEAVKAIIAQALKERQIDYDKFESNVSLLIANAEPDITESVADKILLRYRLKIVCDLLASRRKDFLSSTSRTCRSFEPLKKHLFGIKKCKSVFELNILDLSSLAVLEQEEDRLTELLEAFTRPKVWKVLREPKAALHGSLHGLDREYPPSPFAE